MSAASSPAPLQAGQLLIDLAEAQTTALERGDLAAFERLIDERGGPAGARSYRDRQPAWAGPAAPPASGRD